MGHMNKPKKPTKSIGIGIEGTNVAYRDSRLKPPTKKQVREWEKAWGDLAQADKKNDRSK